MDHELNEPEIKKPYEAPEEAVLGHCKIAGSGGPVSASCAALNCMTLGS
jgi:hypothetical protein